MKKRIAMAGALILAAVVYWAVAQTGPQPLAGVFPTGALLYLEARDFSTLLADWDRSNEKSTWLTSANYEAFSKSALFLKLGQAQTDFATAAGVPPDYPLLKSVAGANSALAIYNIGSLQFLYATHLPSARALNTNLWKARGTYQTRKAGGVDFYVKEDAATKRVAAFAYSGDLLLLATREDLVAGALELLAQAARPEVTRGAGTPPHLASEKWFADATQAAAQNTNPGAVDLRLVHNLDRLERAPQFRSHWVQGNAAALREFSAGVVDLERAGGEMTERRVLLRANAIAAISDEAASGQVLASVPDDAGFYRAHLHPDAGQIELSIAEKIFAATALPKPRNDMAPVIEGETESGNERDLETRIDEPPLTDDRASQAFAELRARLSSTTVQAMLEVGGTSVDAGQVFVGSRSAVVLLSSANWDGDAMRAAIGSAAGSLWSNGGVGAGWKGAANGVQEMDGLERIAMAINGRWLVIGNSVDLVNTIFARRNRAPVAGSVYAAGWRHARELPNFTRLMRLIDFPQTRTSPGEPMFYSENIASFGRVLNRVQSATITVHDAGSMLRESVIYRLTP
jgi:hypothetical protein